MRIHDGGLSFSWVRRAGISGRGCQAGLPTIDEDGEFVGKRLNPEMVKVYPLVEATMPKFKRFAVLSKRMLITLLKAGNLG